MSHRLSGVIVSCSVPVAASQTGCCVTAALHARPYGEDASAFESVITGAGITSAGAPPAPAWDQAIAPPGCWDGTSPPPAWIVNENDGAADADARVIRSFSDVGVT